MSSLSAYATYVKVVESGGFSAAARALGLTKSSVSKQVARLEERLGARLLNRTTRRLSPTEVGTAFYERARRIVAEVEETERAVGELHGEPRGTIRINVPMSFGVLHVAPALADFMTRYPEIVVDMTLNDRVADLVEEGFDLAVRIARLPDSSLIAKRLAPLRQVLCATPDYWRRHGLPTCPEDLKNHNCLIYTYLTSGDEWPFQGPDGPISVKVSGCFRANNGEALRAAALSGRGLMLSPTFIVGDDLRQGHLQPALTDFMETDRAIYAVYPHNRHLSAKVRVFVDFLAERFGPKPHWDCP